MMARAKPLVHARFVDIPDAARGCAIAIGTFDGVHAGHRAVLSRTLQTARQLGCEPGVLIFDPPARRFFDPDAPLRRLMGTGLQDQELMACGIRRIFRVPFDQTVREMSPESFARRVLVERLAARAVIVGREFRFGRNRSGDVTALQALGLKNGFETVIVDEVIAGAGRISSTRIRELISAGELKRATSLLGRPYTLDGIVERGSGDGRRLGWPTANISVVGMLAPPLGIFAVRVMTDRHRDWRPGVSYHGRTPTLGIRDPVFETHIFDFDGDLYGQALRAAVYKWLRPDRKFDGIEELRRQIAADGEATKEALTPDDPLPRSLPEPETAAP